MKKFLRKGFTLTEVIVVLVIIGILAAAATPALLSFVETGRQMNRMAVARTVYLAAQNRLTEMRVMGRLNNEGDPTSFVARAASELHPLLHVLGEVDGWNDSNNEDDRNYRGNVFALIYNPEEHDRTHPVVELLSDILTYQEIFDHAIAIEFNIVTGVVLSVFYSDRVSNLGYLGDDSENDISGIRGMSREGYAGYDTVHAPTRRQGFYGVGYTQSLVHVPPIELLQIRLFDSHDDAFYAPMGWYPVNANNRNNILFANIIIPGELAAVAGAMPFTVSINGMQQGTFSLNSLSSAGAFRLGDPLGWEEDTHVVWILDYVTGVENNPLSISRFNVNTNALITVGVSAMGTTTTSNPRHPFFSFNGSSGGNFTITSARHLHNVRHAINGASAANFTFNVMNDIHLVDNARSNVTPFIPIANFSGTLDGRNNAITGLNVSAPSQNAGLFGNLLHSATVRDLVLHSPNISGDAAGAVAGMSEGHITNVTIMNPIISGTIAGGIVGTNAELGEVVGASVRYELDNASTITGSTMGGLAGENYGTVRDSMFISPNEDTHVNGSTERTGGIVGYNAQYGQIERILMLAVAPSNNDILHPIVGYYVNDDWPTDAINDTLLFLHGQGLRPAMDVYIDGLYNPQPPFNNVGTPACTNEVRRIVATDGWDGWTPSLITDYDAVRLDNPFFPYPAFTAWLTGPASGLIAYPNWPIVAPLDGIYVADLLYFELYDDDTFGFYRSGADGTNTLRNDIPVAEAGFMVVLPPEAQGRDDLILHVRTEAGEWRELALLDAALEGAYADGRQIPIGTGGYFAVRIPLTEMVGIHSTAPRISSLRVFPRVYPEREDTEADVFGFINPLFAQTNRLYDSGEVSNDFSIRTPWQMQNIGSGGGGGGVMPPDFYGTPSFADLGTIWQNVNWGTTIIGGLPIGIGVNETSPPLPTPDVPIASRVTDIRSAASVGTNVYTISTGTRVVHPPANTNRLVISGDANITLVGDFTGINIYATTSGRLTLGTTADAFVTRGSYIFSMAQSGLDVHVSSGMTIANSHVAHYHGSAFRFESAPNTGNVSMNALFYSQSSSGITGNITASGWNAGMIPQFFTTNYIHLTLTGSANMGGVFYSLAGRTQLVMPGVTHFNGLIYSRNHNVDIPTTGILYALPPTLPATGLDPAVIEFLESRGWTFTPADATPAFVGTSFRQTRDMDFITDTGSGSGFTGGGAVVDGVFGGTYNGLHNRINNVTVAGAPNGGLFAQLHTSATVQNIALENISVNAHYNAGAVAGINYGIIRDMLMKNISVTAVHNAGGVAGINEGTIQRIFLRYENLSDNPNPNVLNIHNGMITGDETAGGIAGINNGILTDALFMSASNRSHVMGNGTRGGIVGVHRGTALERILLLALAPEYDGYIYLIAGDWYYDDVTMNEIYFLSGKGIRPYGDYYLLSYNEYYGDGSDLPATSIPTRLVQDINITGWDLVFTVADPTDLTNPYFPYPMFSFANNGFAGIDLSLENFPWPIVMDDDLSILNFFYFEVYMHGDYERLHVSNPFGKDAFATIGVEFADEYDDIPAELLLINDKPVLRAGYVIIVENDEIPLPDYVYFGRQEDDAPWIGIRININNFIPAHTLNPYFPQDALLMFLPLSDLYWAYTAGTDFDRDITRNVPSGATWNATRPDAPLTISAGRALGTLGAIHPFFANALYTQNMIDNAGSEYNPFEVRTPWQLNNVNHVRNYGLYFRQTRDMVMQSGNYYIADGPETGFHEGARFVLNDRSSSAQRVAVVRGGGTTANQFNGNFDGGNYAIHNLVINSPNNPNAGLFDHLNGGVLQNIMLINAHIQGRNTIGGIVGRNRDGLLYNNQVKGITLLDSEQRPLEQDDEEEVDDDGNPLPPPPPRPANARIGGIVGQNSGAIINNTVRPYINQENGTTIGVYIGNPNSARSTQIGGIVGFANTDGPNTLAEAQHPIRGNTVIGATIRGNMSLPADLAPQRMGGIAGNNHRGWIADNTVISTTINGFSELGGIVGYNRRAQGSIYDNTVYAITIIGTGDQVGGVVGRNRGVVQDNTITFLREGTVITPSIIIGNAHVGGVVGDTTNTSIISHNAVEAVAVRANGGRAGGVVGVNAGLVTANTVTGSDVLSNATSTRFDALGSRAGGIAGYNLGRGQVTNNTVLGTTIRGDQHVGGIVSETRVESNQQINITGNRVDVAPPNTVFAQVEIITGTNIVVTAGTAQTAVRVYRDADIVFAGTPASGYAPTRILSTSTNRRSITTPAGPDNIGGILAGKANNATGQSGWEINISDNIVRGAVIDGMHHVGGILGDARAVANGHLPASYQIHRNTVENTTITGRRDVGGIVGLIRAGQSRGVYTHISYARVINTTIAPREGIAPQSTNFGGIVGNNDWGGLIERSGVVNSTIWSHGWYFLPPTDTRALWHGGTGGIVGRNGTATPDRPSIVRDVYFISMADPSAPDFVPPVFSPNIGQIHPTRGAVTAHVGGIVGYNDRAERRVEVTRAFYIAPAPYFIENAGTANETTFIFPIIGHGTPANTVVGPAPLGARNGQLETNFFLAGAIYSLNYYRGNPFSVTWDSPYNTYTLPQGFGGQRVGQGRGLETRFFNIEWLNMITNNAVNFGAWYRPVGAYPYPMVRGFETPDQWPVTDSAGAEGQVDRDNWAQHRPASDVGIVPNFINGNFDWAFAPPAHRPNDPIRVNHSRDHWAYIHMDYVPGWYTRPGVFDAAALTAVDNAANIYGGSLNAEGRWLGGVLNRVQTRAFQWELIEFQRPMSTLVNQAHRDRFGRIAPAPNDAIGGNHRPVDLNSFRYAELNARVPGTLYQVLPTEAGSTFLYSIYHTSLGNNSANRMDFFLTGLDDDAPRVVTNATQLAARDAQMTMIRPIISPRASAGAGTAFGQRSHLVWNTNAWHSVRYANITFQGSTVPLDLSFHQGKSYVQPYHLLRGSANPERVQTIPNNAAWSNIVLFDLWIGETSNNAQGNGQPREGFGISFWAPSNITIGTVAQGVTPTNTRVPITGITLDTFLNGSWTWLNYARNNVIGFWGVENGWRHFYGTYTVPEGQGRTEFAFQSRHATPSNGNFIDSINFLSQAFLTMNTRVLHRNDGGTTNNVADFVTPGTRLSIEHTAVNLGAISASNIVIENMLYPFDAYLNFANDFVGTFGVGDPSRGNLRVTINGVNVPIQSAGIFIDERVDHGRTLSVQLPAGTLLHQNDELRVVFDVDVRETMRAAVELPTDEHFFRTQGVVRFAEANVFTAPDGTRAATNFTVLNAQFNPNHRVTHQNACDPTHNFVFINPLILSKEVSPRIGILPDNEFEIVLGIHDTQTLSTVGLINITMGEGFELVDGSVYRMGVPVPAEYIVVDNERITIREVNIGDGTTNLTYTLRLRYTRRGVGVTAITVATEYAYMMVADGEPVSLTLRFPERFVGLAPTAPSPQYEAFYVARGADGESGGASIPFLGDVFENVYAHGGYVVITNENIQLDLLSSTFNGITENAVSDIAINHGPFIIVLEADGNDIFRLNVTLAETGSTDGPEVGDYIDVDFRLRVIATGPGATGPAGDFNFDYVYATVRLTVVELPASAMFFMPFSAMVAFDTILPHCDCHHFSCADGYNPDCDCPICPQHNDEYDGLHVPDYSVDMRKEDDELHAITREEDFEPVPDDDENDDDPFEPEGFESAIDLVYDAYEYLNSSDANSGDNHVSGYVGGYDPFDDYAENDVDENA
ncbi:MAG: prepilin-type N-terminal cleavage/methylation domain-containing protein [Defluviitaleaceae bacterium]|nr:prepilin-type N-terminal cleavage/methylation domain-containing protein [Defluviitaleaceae bacterium]MCL2274316.1 prepilin-type N-terminal cleavage/methylation domain-containing protein [Defluviitaleaceae bacterium]